MIAAVIILPLHRLKLAKTAISKAEKRFLSPSFIYLLFQFLLLINQGLPLFLQEEFPTDALCYWIKVLLTMLIPYHTATYLLSPMQEIPDFGKNWLETRNKSSWYSDVTQGLWPLFVQPWIFKSLLYENHTLIIPISKSITQCFFGIQSPHTSFLLKPYSHLEFKSKSFGQWRKQWEAAWETEELFSAKVRNCIQISDFHKAGEVRNSKVLQLWGKPLPSFSRLHNPELSLMATWLTKQLSLLQISTWNNMIIQDKTNQINT